MRDVRGAAGKVRPLGFEVGEDGELFMVPTDEELAPFAKIRWVSDGVIRHVQRDGPRMSRDVVSRLIRQRRPDLSVETAGRLAEEYIADKRTNASESRISYVYDRSEEKGAKLSCRVCGAQPTVSRRSLGIVVNDADRIGADVFVSPRGSISISGELG
jgi:hypothetical protein